MRGSGMILTVLVGLAVGYYVYTTQFKVGPGGEVVSPKAQIDVVGIQSDLLSIANAERLYLASHGSYATVEQLRQEGSLLFSPTHRRGYNFVSEINGGMGFRITAVPADPTAEGWPSFSIDQNMQVTRR